MTPPQCKHLVFGGTKAPPYDFYQRLPRVVGSCNDILILHEKRHRKAGVFLSVFSYNAFDNADDLGICAVDRGIIVIFRQQPNLTVSAA